LEESSGSKQAYFFLVNHTVSVRENVIAGIVAIAGVPVIKDGSKK
jgi:hypothetical protein